MFYRRYHGLCDKMKGHGNDRGRRWYIYRGCVLIAYVAVAKQRLLAKTVPTSGHRAGLANVAGFVTAFYVHEVLLVPGISTVLVPSAICFGLKQRRFELNI
jgi:hypothetical protein